jgi:hypothetical protein
MLGDFNLPLLSFCILSVVGVISYYFYTRFLYMEKKVTFLQNILMEMKLQERSAQQVEMLNPMNGAVFQNPEEVSKEEVEELPEEEYYNNVAAAVPAVPEEELKDVSDVSVPVVNYESFSKQELLAAVKQRSLKASKTAKITELVALLRKDDELKSQAVVEPSVAEGSLGSVLELNA